MSEFYVYMHRRADTGMPFYVGKGKGARVRVTQHRNAYWQNVTKKAGGWTADIVVRNLDEPLAHLAEMELIDKYRALGIRLTNLTDGGEGATGFRWDREAALRRASSRKGIKRPDVSARFKGVQKSAQHRARLAEAKRGVPMSQEARAAMSAAQRLARRRKQVQKEMFRRYGHRDSDETRAKKSKARIGELNPRFGVQISEDQKARQIASLKARPRVKCQHCSRSMDEANARRWHGDNCKERS